MKPDSEKPESNKCPKCKFAGKDSDKNKFSLEQIEQFPKGYAPEKHPRIEIVKSGGKDVQVFAKNKDKHIIFDEIKRCPLCGYVEGETL